MRKILAIILVLILVASQISAMDDKHFMDNNTADLDSPAANRIVSLSPEEEALKELISGKKLSILGDSISTYTGWSNSTAVNNTLENNALWYHSPSLLATVEDTWWMQAADRLGMEILVNNSWSGSTVTSVRDELGVQSYGWNTRPGNLHDNTLDNNPNGAPINPDIIAIYMGTCDLYRDVSANTNFTDAFWEKVEAESFVPPAASDFEEACALMVYKVRKSYPNADIFLFNNPTMSFGAEENRMKYNVAYQVIADRYGCTVVELHDTPLSDYVAYTIDGIHPNAAGMDIMTEAFVDALVQRYVNHVHTEVNDKAVSPNCTAPGKTEGMHCSLAPSVCCAVPVGKGNGLRLPIPQCLHAIIADMSLRSGRIWSRQGNLLWQGQKI